MLVSDDGGEDSGDMWSTMVVNEQAEGARLDLTTENGDEEDGGSSGDMWSTMVVRDDVEGVKLSAVSSEDLSEEDGGGDMWSTMVVKDNVASQKLNIGTPRARAHTTQHDTSYVRTYDQGPCDVDVDVDPSGNKPTTGSAPVAMPTPQSRFPSIPRAATASPPPTSAPTASSSFSPSSYNPPGIFGSANAARPSSPASQRFGQAGNQRVTMPPGTTAPVPSAAKRPFGRPPPPVRHYPPGTRRTTTAVWCQRVSCD
jgi:hypothetical protein